MFKSSIPDARATTPVIAGTILTLRGADGSAIRLFEDGDKTYDLDSEGYARRIQANAKVVGRNADAVEENRQPGFLKVVGNGDLAAFS